MSSQYARVPVKFIFYRTEADRLVETGQQLIMALELNITYEEIIDKLIQGHFLLPLNDPQLRYALFFKDVAKNNNGYNISGFVREGETPHDAIGGLAGAGAFTFVECDISIDIKASLPPKEKPSGASPSLGETFFTDLTSREATAVANFITIATGLIAFIGALKLVAKHWSKKHSTDSASSQGVPPEPSKSDIVAIRLRMTHGPDQEFEEWLTDADRLKHYIDVFNQPSSSIQPLQAIFVQRNGKAIKVDVSKGTQNNPQLNELLSNLNIGSEQK